MIESQVTRDSDVQGSDHQIAIIGLACTFPGATHYQQYWHCLEHGVNSVDLIPGDRWSASKYYSMDSTTPNTSVSKWGGFIQDIDAFDATFFGITPREAIRMDPQQRKMLELSWACLEDAGYCPSELMGRDVGVFVGVCNYDYEELLLSRESSIEGHTLTGNQASILPNRISYFFNFHGPSFPIDTACSSSLIALHQAIAALRAGECEMALVGGVNLYSTPTRFISLSKLGMLSPTGQCRAFDAAADGYVRAEGAGFVLLKPFTSALTDRDPLYGVILGSAVNHGGHSRTLTSPNVYAQSKVIRMAYQQAGISPGTITFIETHGTGTPLGDPIEINGLKRAFTQLFQHHHITSPPQGYCGLGAVKTNIGHAEGAAGIAGLIKVLLAMKHQKLPKLANFSEQNPRVKLEGSPFYLLTETQEWQQLQDASGQPIPRRAGLSSFGFGGANAHVVLEEPPVREVLIPKVERSLHLCALSAKTDQGLRQQADAYRVFIQQNPELRLADICFTANVGRTHFEHRLAVIATSCEELQEKLVAFAGGNQDISGLLQGETQKSQTQNVAFLLTGQGSQYRGMGRELYQTQPTFKQALEQCAQILEAYLDQPLLQVLYADGDSPLSETAYTQPALFALEYSLAQMWISWGIKPQILMGHSVGEYVAACLAEVFSLEDGLKLIAQRARLMQSLSSDGAMVSALANPETVQMAIAGYADQVSIAAYNGPESVVFSGERQAVETVARELEAQGIKVRPLDVSQGFHSPLMDPMLQEFEQIASQINFQAPQIPIISNLTGNVIGEDIATSDYWVKHVRQAVRFAQGMQTLQKQGVGIYLEVGPKPILLGMGQQCLVKDTGVWLPSLRQGQSDWNQVLQSLAQLYIHGAQVNWSGFDQDYPRQRLSGLPTYPFERQRYWVDAPEHSPGRGPLSSGQRLPSTRVVELLDQGQVEDLVHLLSGTPHLSAESKAVLPDVMAELVRQHRSQQLTQTLSSWFYRIEWQSVSPPARSAPVTQGIWLILADHQGIAQALVNLLKGQGFPCVVVTPGPSFLNPAPNIYQVNPENSADFATLLREMATSGGPPTTIVHLWNVDQDDFAPDAAVDASIWETQQHLGCGSVIWLLQALTQDLTTPPAKLWLISRGAQSVNSGSEPLNVGSASMWGLGRVIAQEHPLQWGGMLDLDPVVTPATAAHQIFLEITGAGEEDREDHCAYRGQQRYVGQLVRCPLEIPAGGVASCSLSGDATYLVTGGLGALGLSLAEQLVGWGARHLVLLSRRTISDATHTWIQNLQSQGVEVVVAAVDISQLDQLQDVFNNIEQHLPRLRGIFHAAGVLKDKTLQQMTWSDVWQVMRAKVVGSWNLHVLSQKQDLDFCVFFSSAAALLGSGGQGNYAAANAFMDGLAAYRRRQGLPGLSLNWGPWATLGMAASLETQQQQRLLEYGIQTISQAEGWLALSWLLQVNPPAQIGIFPVDWTRFGQAFHPHSPALVKRLLATEAPATTELSAEPIPPSPTIRSELEGMPDEQRVSFLIRHLKGRVARVMGFAEPQVDTEKGFFEMGLDSLMAVELRNRLQSDFDLSISATLLFNYPSIEALAVYLVQALSPSQQRSMAEPISEPAQVNQDEARDPTLEEIEALTEQDIASILAEKLKSYG